VTRKNVMQDFQQPSNVYIYIDKQQSLMLLIQCHSTVRVQRSIDVCSTKHHSTWRTAASIHTSDIARRQHLLASACKSTIDTDITDQGKVKQPNSALHVPWPCHITRGRCYDTDLAAFPRSMSWWVLRQKCHRRLSQQRSVSCQTSQHPAACRPNNCSHRWDHTPHHHNNCMSALAGHSRNGHSHLHQDHTQALASDSCLNPFTTTTKWSTK